MRITRTSRAKAPSCPRRVPARDRSEAQHERVSRIEKQATRFRSFLAQRTPNSDVFGHANAPIRFGKKKGEGTSGRGTPRRATQRGKQEGKRSFSGQSLTRSMRPLYSSRHKEICDWDLWQRTASRSRRARPRATPAIRSPTPDPAVFAFAGATRRGHRAITTTHLGLARPNDKRAGESRGVRAPLVPRIA